MPAQAIGSHRKVKARTATAGVRCLACWSQCSTRRQRASCQDCGSSCVTPPTCPDQTLAAAVVCACGPARQADGAVLTAIALMHLYTCVRPGLCRDQRDISDGACLGRCLVPGLAGKALLCDGNRTAVIGAQRGLVLARVSWPHRDAVRPWHPRGWHEPAHRRVHGVSQSCPVVPDILMPGPLTQGTMQRRQSGGRTGARRAT